MVNNSTNINKTSNNISPKESLSNDGQQFHQYQQNKQLPLTSTQAPCFVDIGRFVDHHCLTYFR
jgi:hypothetical protein